MDTNGNETVTNKLGSTKDTDCTIYCVHHVSLPSKTELAQFKRKELPPFVIIVSVSTKETISITKLFMYFFLFFINTN